MILIKSIAEVGLPVEHKIKINPIPGLPVVTLPLLALLLEVFSKKIPLSIKLFKRYLLSDINYEI